MMSFRLRPEAETDIESIARYIAEENPSAARRWVDDLYLRCQRLGGMPGMGVARPDVRPNLRMLVMGNYLILLSQKAAGWRGREVVF
jgi:toxin ParE1/3/4